MMRTEDVFRSRIVGHDQVPPDTLLANPANWRRHPKQQAAALEEVLQRVGWVQSVIVNRRTGLLVDGHLRVELARHRGEPFVPVAFVDLDEAEESLILATLDPLAGLAETDRDQLEGLLQGLLVQDAALRTVLGTLATENGIDLAATLDGTLPDEDLEDVPEPPAVPVTTPGELIILGRHRLHCADATRPEAYGVLLDGELADMVWTDPPYNVAYQGKTADALTIQNDAMDDAAFRAFLLAFFDTTRVVTKPGGPIYVAHADSEGLNFRGAMQEGGWLLKQCLVWVKQAFVLGRQDYHWQHEPILYGWAPGAAHAWAGDRTQSTVLRFDRPARNGDHPTMKPVGLVAACLKNSSHPGDLVLDPFGGSGTTLIAAEKTGRAARLLELDPRYCDVIVARWGRITGRRAERRQVVDLSL